MSDWETEDFEPVIKGVNTKVAWDDEEAAEPEFKAAWDDEEAETISPEAKTDSAPTKKKKSLAMKIAEKEESERKRAELETGKVKI